MAKVKLPNNDYAEGTVTLDPATGLPKKGLNTFHLVSAASTNPTVVKTNLEN